MWGTSHISPVTEINVLKYVYLGEDFWRLYSLHKITGALGGEQTELAGK